MLDSLPTGRQAAFPQPRLCGASPLAGRDAGMTQLFYMLRETIRQLLSEAIKAAQQHDQLPFFDFDKIEISVAPKETGADYSTNIALVAAKQTKQNSLNVAKIIEEYLRQGGAGEPGECVGDFKIVPPGFINFYVQAESKAKELALILKEKEDYGNLKIGQGQKIQVEFISANPTGPLTLGNGRGGFYGDVLANILAKVGFAVTREYLINDAGHQVEVLGHSILNNDQTQYKGEYIDKLRRKFTGWFASKDPKVVGQQAAAYILAKMIQPTIKDRMKIKFDNWVSEKELYDSGDVEAILKILKAKNLTCEQDGATWFKSTQFGDDKDRVLITSAKDGRGQEATYLLPDIAYHYKKFTKDKFDVVIDIWGADHHGYVKRLLAAKQALQMPGELKIIIMQLVRLFAHGQEVKMSKRLGTYITLDELLAEIPLDVARFFFLMHSPNTHMDFDLDLAREQSQKNPVYYVQYAYARIRSILRKTSQEPLPLPEGKPASLLPLPEGPLRQSDSEAREIKRGWEKNLNLLSHPSELALINQLIRFPEIIADTALDYQVHRLPQYALNLVRSFHKFYEDCKVIDEKNKDITAARLALCEATKIVLTNTLLLMEISAPEKM